MSDRYDSFEAEVSTWPDEKLLKAKADLTDDIELERLIAESANRSCIDAEIRRTYITMELDRRRGRKN